MRSVACAYVNRRYRFENAVGVNIERAACLSMKHEASPKNTRDGIIIY